ncbi:hypothetical protein [Brevibacillus centrosporus]|jgi:hypothetical protein|uniref:hypothetical protein n=1 Tax=Brevibacillus centrosporus TaxID=54910 RepID=UPI002E1ECD4E|nr:hypothetical protein [Brevibacillus centrosporus]
MINVDETDRLVFIQRKNGIVEVYKDGMKQNDIKSIEIKASAGQVTVVNIEHVLY